MLDMNDPNAPSSEIPAEPPVRQNHGPADAPIELPPAFVPEPPRPLVLGPAEPRARNLIILACTILCTIFATVVFFVLEGVQAFFLLTHDRSENLDAPGEFIEHVVGRDLDLEEYAERRPDWEKQLDRLLGTEPGDTLEQAIEAYDDFIDNTETEWLRPRRTLAILLAEAGRFDEADQELSKLEYEESEQPFVAAVRFAYGDETLDLPLPRLDQVVALVNPQWARDKLIVRVAEKLGDQPAAGAAQARLDARAKKLYDQTAPLNWGPWLLIVVGLVILLAWVICGLPRPQLAEGLTVSLWSVGRGYAVMICAAALGIIIQYLLAFMLLENIPVLAGFGSLLAIVPLLVLASWHLLRPWRLTLSSCFGLAVPLRRWGGLVLFTIALAGLDQLGTITIDALMNYLGIHMNWAENPQELYLWKPWWIVWLDFMDGTVWAPICEEIGCRCFLYTTIRRKLPTLPAAILTGLIFGAAHFYSLSGFLQVAWSGFLWSLAYEKSRSLLPGMISHSLCNILAFGGTILMYRV